MIGLAHLCGPIACLGLALLLEYLAPVLVVGWVWATTAEAIAEIRGDYRSVIALKFTSRFRQ